MPRRSSQWFIPIVLAVAAAAALLYYWLRVSQPEPEPVPPPSPAAVEPAEPPGPLHPVPAVASGTTRPADLVPLPPLDQSDQYFKLELVGLFGASLEEMLADSGVIERVVATVDNLPRAELPERIRPLGRVGGQFMVDGQDGSGEFTINPDNYRRYDTLVELATAADLAEFTDLYRRFYPLLQKAYVELGYPDGYFNDRLVEVIDHLMATPEVDEPIALVRPHVLYEYRDAELEALSSGQKLLLRMGPEHRARIRSRLRELRSLITSM